MASIKISVLNESTVLSDAQVQPVIPALQTQVSRDFAPAWGIDADLSFVPKGSKPPSGAWQLVILDDSDQAGALGYHDVTSDGLPIAKAFADSDIKAGLSWTVTVSHELLEMLADPEIDLTVFVQTTSSTTGTLYAYEVCDAVEADNLGYSINSTLVSDFVYPAWFESFRTPSSTRFDFQNKVTKPFELLPGGYIGVFDVTAGSGWQQLTSKVGTKAPPIERIDSREERRKRPREKWVRSKKP